MKFWRIKWENINAIFYGLSFVCCIISHIKRNGFDFNVIGLEILIYAFLLTGIYVSTYFARQAMLESKSK